MSPVLVCNKRNKTNMIRRRNDLGRKSFFLSVMANVLHQLLGNQDNISTVHNPKESEIMKMTENDFYRWSRWRFNKQLSQPPVPKPTEAIQGTNTTSQRPWVLMAMSMTVLTLIE